MLDLDKTIFRKVNDEEIRVYQITILQHLYEYLIIGSNKGLIIFKFDSSNKAPLCTLSMIPTIDKKKVQNYFFYHLTKNNILLEQKLMISFDKKNKMLLNSDSKKIEDNILDNSKVSINRYEIRLSFDCTLMSCLDTVANVYIIFRIIPDKRNNNPNCIGEIKKVESGEALCLEWSPYANNFAITKQLTSNTFTLQVYSAADRNSIKKIYEVKDLFTHKIFGGHFIGVIVRKNGEHLQVPMKYINNYNYEVSKEAELNFYYWDEENKLICEKC